MSFVGQVQGEMSRLRDRYGHPGSFLWIPGYTYEQQIELLDHIVAIETLAQDAPNVGDINCGSWIPGDDPAFWFEAVDVYAFDVGCGAWLRSIDVHMVELAVLIEQIDPASSQGAVILADIHDQVETLQAVAGEVTPTIPDLLNSADDVMKMLMWVAAAYFLLRLIEGGRRRW